MTLEELKAKISPIRSLVESLQSEARDAWEAEEDIPLADDFGEIAEKLEEIADALAELED